MKIALAQINTTVGALAGNAAKIVEWVGRARDRGAALVVFPELTLTGYPPMDLLEMPHFVEAQLDHLEEVARQVTGITAVVGYAERNPREGGKPLLNAAAVLAEGRVRSRHDKRLIPTYDVFDESRYFEAGSGYSLESLAGLPAGVSICEDIWNDKGHWGARRYREDPIEALRAKGAQLLVNISGSPFHVGKPAERHQMLTGIARRYGLWVLYVNLVGGNDTLIFDGHSAVVAPDGALRAQAKGFEEDLVVCDLEADAPAAAEAPQTHRAAEAYRALVLGLRDYAHKCGFSRAVVGLSGGVDSALTALLAADALGAENVRALALPSPYSSPGSQKDAFALANNLGIGIDRIEIGPLYEAFREQLAPVLRPRREGEITVVEENLQARCRGTLLMALSNDTRALVLSTGNKSETAVGYTTLYGDMCGGLAVIGDVPKTLVYEVARYANEGGERIPEQTLTKPPSAELRPDQTDEDSLPPYAVLDPILEAYVEENKSIEEIAQMGYEAALVRRVIAMVDANEYKRRQAPPILRLTHRAFGPGRQIPMAQRYRQR